MARAPVSSSSRQGTARSGGSAERRSASAGSAPPAGHAGPGRCAARAASARHSAVRTLVGPPAKRSSARTSESRSEAAASASRKGRREQRPSSGFESVEPGSASGSHPREGRTRRQLLKVVLHLGAKRLRAKQLHLKRRGRVVQETVRHLRPKRAAARSATPRTRRRRSASARPAQITRLPRLLRHLELL